MWPWRRPAIAEQYLPQGLTPHNFREVSFLSFNRKDDMAAEFVARAFGLKRVALNHLFVPGSEAQMRAVAAGWAVGVVPELMAREALADGSMVESGAGPLPAHPAVLALLEPGVELLDALDALTAALTATAARTHWRRLRHDSCRVKRERRSCIAT